MASILPNGKVQFIDQNGKPLAGGSVTFYEPGTTTKIDTYQDVDLTIVNQNPVPLDSRGQALIWGNTNYRQVVKDANGVTVWDQITAAPVSFVDLGNAGSSLIQFDGEPLSTVFMSRVNRVVDSIAALRTLSKLTYARAFVTGYYAPHDGGGGAYQLDLNDTSTVDNGGTVIVAADGGRWKLQLVGPVSAKQFGARGNGVAGSNIGNDDTSALQNWLTALSVTLPGDLPAAVYNISASLTKVASNITINTDGAANVVINWIGTATDQDLIVLGDGTTTCSYWKVGGLGFESATKMTAGAAIHVRKFMVHNDFEEIACGVLSGNGNLFRGAWFDLVNVCYLGTIAASKCQDAGLSVNGSATDDTGSDLLITRGNIQFCGSGIHQGGGFGGLRTGSVNLYGNGTGFLLDTALAARLNRELYLQRGTVIDSSTVAGLIINDTLTSNAPITIDADIGSSGVNGGTGPFHGLWIKSWANGRLSLNCGQLLNNQGNAIQADDASCIVLLCSTSFVFNTKGYGVASAVTNNNVYNGGAYFDQNAAGNFHPNVNGADGDNYTPTISAQAGSIPAGGYTAVLRWTKIGKIATFTTYITITNNGTGAGSLSITLPFVVRQPIVVVGKEIGVSGKLVAGFVNANSNIESVTNFDNSYPASNGAVFVLSGACEVQ